MKIKIEIETSNAAFEDNASHETARIFRVLADRIDGHPYFRPGHRQPLRDYNGNTVGYFDILED